MEIHRLFASFLHSILTPNPSHTLLCHKALQCFNAKQVPDISIEEFLERFAVYLQTDPSTYVAAYVLIERLVKKIPGASITLLNVHRLLVAAITLSEKILNDFYYRNADYAIVGAITNEELNTLEIELLKGLDYDLRIESEVYEKTWKSICEKESAISDY
eukprot:TRINITY_DN14858_c0_g1_i5.p1 TRINITY_DN14858_c0_g1~~TRINITY_DN14858_c0_g1_i5.p1  ORF type:complete len:160 (-),score=28.25 TRINITY_DN14858_c0_g1_i5:279-758(-)